MHPAPGDLPPAAPTAGSQTHPSGTSPAGRRATPGSGRKPERPPCSPPSPQAWEGEGVPAAALWGADAQHRPKSAPRHVGSALPVCTGEPRQALLPPRSRSSRRLLPLNAFAAGEPVAAAAWGLLPAAACRLLTPAWGPAGKSRCSLAAPYTGAFQAGFDPGDTPLSAPRGVGRSSAGRSSAGSRAAELRKVISRPAAEAGGHGAHGHGSTEHPWSQGRAPAGAGHPARCATKLAASRQGSCQRCHTHRTHKAHLCGGKTHQPRCRCRP